jgi:hypothetical protein
MPETPSLQSRYNQFFVLFLLCSFIYVMIQTARGGIENFQDHFYQMGPLRGSANLLKMKLGDKVFPGALMERDGWMEYTGEGTIDDFQNARPWENLNDLGRGLTTLNEYLEQQGITLLIVVAPNKTSIYPEKLPEELKTLPSPSRLDTLISYLDENCIPTLDLRPALRTARQEGDVYYKTDTHWNGYGAFVAYTTIIDVLGSSYPQLKPYQPADLNLETIDPAVREIPGMLDINYPALLRTTSLEEMSQFFVPSEDFVHELHPGYQIGYNQLSWIPDSNLPTLLMFHDSFGKNYLNNYLSMNFSESHFIFLADMPQYLTKESIQKFSPDIIIIEIVERNMQDLPLYFPWFMLE